MAGTLKLLSGGAAQALVGRLAARSAVAVEGTFGAVGAMRDKLLSGAPCDVLILTGVVGFVIVTITIVTIVGIVAWETGSVATIIKQVGELTGGHRTIRQRLENRPPRFVRQSAKHRLHN